MKSQGIVEKAVAPAPSGQVATSIGEALVFLQREAHSAGLSALAESLSHSITVALKSAVEQ